MKRFFTAALMLMSAVAFAGDTSSLTHIGFSEDGKSYAFMESGMQDGSGFSYATIKFLDVASNKYARPEVHVQEDETTPEGDLGRKDMRALAIKNADASLKALKIKQGTGEVLVSRKITDLDAAKLTSASFSTAHKDSADLSYSSQTISLKVSASKLPQGMFCWEGEVPQKLSVSLTNNQSKKAKILQNDSIIPKSRGCAQSYAIEDVIVSGQGVVVLVRVSKTGFEGPDRRFMAISGTME